MEKLGQLDLRQEWELMHLLLLEFVQEWDTHLKRLWVQYLVAGVLFLIISLTPIRAWLINSIPKSLKLGIGAGIGLFLAIIGLQIMEVVVDDPVTW